jgi:hypothetical protein
MTSKTFEELNGEGVSGKCERMWPSYFTNICLGRSSNNPTEICPGIQDMRAKYNRATTVALIV